MVTKTCKTCRYWSDRYTVNSSQMSDCGYLTMCPPRDKYGNAYIEARAADDSGLDAVLMTHANFGCIQHCEKIEE
jgi:predicted metal-dependent RNase